MLLSNSQWRLILSIYEVLFLVDSVLQPQSVWENTTAKSIWIELIDNIIRKYRHQASFNFFFYERQTFSASLGINFFMVQAFS